MKKNSTWQLMSAKPPTHAPNGMALPPMQSTPAPAISGVPDPKQGVHLFKKPIYVDHVLNHSLNFKPIRKIQTGGGGGGPFGGSGNQEV